MKDRHEVLLTGDESGAVSNLAVWDAGTGTCLHQYKGGTTSPATVTLAAQPDWVLSAPPGKPLLNAWQVTYERHCESERKYFALVSVASLILWFYSFPPGR